ncbi:MAG: hypothetical protein ISR77_09635 [Pirellulaceae bacterium]|nr:hypothetical protein [Pirellulaceae bacterium]
MTLHTVFVLCLLASDLSYQENFVNNPSFEEDRDRDTLPDGWRPYAFDSPAGLEWDDTASRTGKRSFKISDSFRSGDQRDWQRCTGRWVAAARPIEAGSEYKLEVWVKTEGVTGQAYAHLAWQRGSRWLNETATERVSGTEDWQKLTVLAVAPAEADALIVSLNLARSKGSAWFDDVKVSGKSDELPTVEYVFKDTKDWFPFEFPLDDTNLDSIDLTGLLDAPAGKRGFVTVRPDGHFYFEDGTRARFFGTNVGGRDCAPDKDLARVVAARLAKYGVNMLRLHSMDGRWGPLIDYRDGTSQQFDADALDRIDYFIAELKKRGIYVYLDLLDYRQFRTADGVKHGDEFTHNWQGSMKGASIFDERMIELQKDYATKLLTHRNPYTGLRYVDEPAVAVVETTNENSIFYFFNMSGLSLPYYRDQLQQRWNQWLASRYDSREKLASAWTDDEGRCALLPDEVPAKGNVALSFGMLSRFRPTVEGKPVDPLLSPPRVSDLLRFFVEIQRHYYDTMRVHLKQLGVRVPVAGTNQQFVVVDTEVDSMNDFMSRNQYWRHPHRSAKPFYKFANDALVHVDIPTERNPLSVIARTTVAGKPQAVAEFNFPWPNEYRSEGLLMSAAYSCLQDWDIFLLFSYELKDKRLSMFRSQSDPARWGEFPAAAMMFHRNDVAAARNEVHVVHTPEDTYTPRPHTRNAKYTNYRFLTFTSKVRNVFIEDAYRGAADVVLACGPSAEAEIEGNAKVVRLAERPWEQWLYPKFVEAARELRLAGYDGMDAETKRMDSDTGELSLDYGEGVLTINTPCTKSAIGYLAKADAIDLDGLRIDCQTEFATVTATSLDGAPIGQSRHILLTSVGRAENTAQGFWPPTAKQRSWGSMSWMLPGEGRLPVIVEPVQAEVRLRVPGPATVYALDATGKRGDRLEATIDSGTLRLNPAAARSIWCEIVVP